MSTTGLKIEASDFCTENFRELFHDFVKSSYYPLLLSRRYDDVVDMWIKLYLVKSILSKSSSLTNDSASNLLLTFLDETNVDFAITYKNVELKPVLNEVNAHLLNWAREEWGHRLESIYLESKDNLDAVTFEMIRVKDNFLAVELYYRLTAKEQSFAQISWEYGEGPEKRHAGLFSTQRLQDLPEGLPNLLKKLKPGEVAKPRLFGNYYTVLKLISFQSAQFDQDMQNYLLKSQLAAFLDEVRGCLAQA